MTALTTVKDRLLTVPEAATIMAISTKQVRRLISSKELPHIRIGTRVRITTEDLQNYIARMRQARPL